MGSEERVDRLELRLRAIEDRLSLLEGSKPPTLVEEAEPRVAISSPSEGILALAAKAVFVLGGAFLLRAATESTALPPHAGVISGLLYAVVWIVAATRAAKSGRRTAAVFHFAAAAAVMYPVIWEAATRFHVLPVTAAAVLLAVVSVAFLLLAKRFSLQSPAWIAVAGATFDGLLLSYPTGDVIPFAFELTAVGVVAILLSMRYAGWLLAIESDLIALFLIIAGLMDDGRGMRPMIAIALLIVAASWMIASRQMPAQAAVVVFIGIAGASVLTLQPVAMAMVAGFAALVAAEASRRFARIELASQSAAFGVLAAVSGGLIAAIAAALADGSEAAGGLWSVLVTGGLCLASFFRLAGVRVVHLAIAVSSIASVGMVAATRAIHGTSLTNALLRTAILSIVALALAMIARVWRAPEASRLAVVALALTGVQVIAQELITGNAVVIFAALAIYGSAMLGIAWSRRTPATT